MPSRKLCSLLFALILGLLTSHAHAQTVGTSVLTVTLDSGGVLTATPGQDVLFTGIFTNVPTDINNTGDTLTISGTDTGSFTQNGSDAFYDDTPYLSVPGEPGYDALNGTPDTVGTGLSTGDLGLFNIDVLSTATPGEQILGTYTADYTDSSSSAFTTAPVSFTVNVLAPQVTAVPEPSTSAELLAGMVALMLICRGKRPMRQRAM